MTRKIALLGAAVLALFIFGSFYLQLTQGPSRTQITRLDPYGDINVHLETEPDPPKTGPIPLILHLTDQRGKRIEVDRVQYEYAFQGRDPETLVGKTTGVGEFQAIAALEDVGEWRVRVTLFMGNQQAQVDFTLRVES